MSFLDALRSKLLSPAGIGYARKGLAERLGEMSKLANAEIAERRSRLGRTEGRIHGLIRFIGEGDQSDYVRSALVDLEAQATADKAAITDIERQAAEPVRLPSPDALLERVFEMDRLLMGDPFAGREALRRLLKDGRINLSPQPDRVYLARTEVLPLVLMAEKDHRRPSCEREAPMYCSRSGGEI